MSASEQIGAGPARHGEATLVELSVMLARAFGSPAGDAPIAPDLLAAGGALDAQRLASVPTVVLILLDGAGCAAIERHVGSGTIAAGRCLRLDSVFPSSTAPAITSLVSGLAPSVHGNSGWFLWSEAHGRVLRSLPMDWRGAHGEAPADWCWPWRGWIGAAPADAVAIQPMEIYDSAFSRHALAGAALVGYRDLDGFVEQIIAAARQPRRGRRLVYAYAPHFDACCHDHGWQGEAAHECLNALDRSVGAVLAALQGQDALVMVTADHGFCDVPPERQFDIADFGSLARDLRAPLTGEPRVAFCHLRAGRERAFVDEARERLGGIADVHRSADLLCAGWFGRRVAAPREAFGDVTLVMRPHTAIGDRLPGERPHRMLGMHGGASDEEMAISLSVFDMRA
ncbi:MAG: alkaline phosphatase family protein [Burkholderiaceae bacterium]